MSKIKKILTNQPELDKYTKVNEIKFSANDVVRAIGGAIVEVDVLRGSLEADSANRVKLDNIRDDLDASQRKIVRGKLLDNSDKFVKLTEKLNDTNTKVNQTIDDIDKLAATLENLKVLVGIAQKFVELAAVI